MNGVKMSEELEQLSRRLVGCKGWRWLPGMRASLIGMNTGWRILSHSDFWYEGEGIRDSLPGGPTNLPDLTDPATLGCLLYLVREAWGDPGFYTAQSSTKIKGTDIFGWDTFGYLHGRSCKGMLYRSEAEALVSALESAS